MGKGHFFPPRLTSLVRSLPGSSPTVDIWPRGFSVAFAKPDGFDPPCSGPVQGSAPAPGARWTLGRQGAPRFAVSDPWGFPVLIEPLWEAGGREQTFLDRTLVSLGPATYCGCHFCSLC